VGFSRRGRFHARDRPPPKRATGAVRSTIETRTRPDPVPPLLLPRYRTSHLNVDRAGRTGDPGGGSAPARSSHGGSGGGTGAGPINYSDADGADFSSRPASPRYGTSACLRAGHLWVGHTVATICPQQTPLPLMEDVDPCRRQRSAVGHHDPALLPTNRPATRRVWRADLATTGQGPTVGNSPSTGLIASTRSTAASNRTEASSSACLTVSPPSRFART
jgi:hypothetical protein